MHSIDGGRCLEILRQIWENDRFGDFRHFAKTSEVVAQILAQAGCAEIERLRLSADGRTRYGDWTMPRAWDLHAASLRLIFSDGTAKTLCDSSVTPLCVMMFSASAPRKQFEAVWAERTEPDAWKGRILYTQNAPKAIVPAALEHGAAGIVSDWFPTYPGVREADDPMEDACRWENDLFYPKNPTDLFGFTLPRSAGAALRGQFESGAPVTLEAEVDTAHYDGANYVVSGLIPGEGTDEEIMLCGHLYEPGANDNASGCALLCCLAEVLNREHSGRRRGIRLVMGYESAGMSGYVAAHPERMRRTIAALNCDMVGAAPAEKAVLKLWKSPLSTGDFAIALLKDEAGKMGIPFEISPFDIGDCLVADPSIGVPCCSLVMHPAISYHSSMDTPDRVSSETLERCGELALTWAKVLCAPDNEDISRVEALLKREYGELLANPDDPALPLKIEAHERAREAFERWAFGGPIPRRRLAGPATMDGTLRLTCPELDPFYNIEYNTALFHVDGRRTLKSVIRRTCMELNLEQTKETEARFVRFFELMQRAGRIDLEGM